MQVCFFLRLGKEGDSETQLHPLSASWVHDNSFLTTDNRLFVERVIWVHCCQFHSFAAFLTKPALATCLLLAWHPPFFRALSSLLVSA
jgi:hypothetical protein